MMGSTLSAPENLLGGKSAKIRSMRIEDGLKTLKTNAKTFEAIVKAWIRRV